MPVLDNMRDRAQQTQQALNQQYPFLSQLQFKPLDEFIEQNLTALAQTQARTIAYQSFARWLSHVTEHLVVCSLHPYAKMQYHNPADSRDNPLTRLSENAQKEDASYWLNVEHLLTQHDADNLANSHSSQVEIQHIFTAFKNVASTRHEGYQAFQNSLQTYYQDLLSRLTRESDAQDIVDSLVYAYKHALPTFMVLIADHMIDQINAQGHDALRAHLLKNINIYNAQTGQLIQGWVGNVQRSQQLLSSLIIDKSHGVPKSEVLSAVFDALTVILRNNLNFKNNTPVVQSVWDALKRLNDTKTAQAQTNLKDLGLLINRESIDSVLYLVDSPSKTMAAVINSLQLHLYQSNVMAHAANTALPARKKQMTSLGVHDDGLMHHLDATAEFNRWRAMQEHHERFTRKIRNETDRSDFLMADNAKKQSEIDGIRKDIDSEQRYIDSLNSEVNGINKWFLHLNHDSREISKIIRETIATVFEASVGRLLPQEVKNALLSYQKFEFGWETLLPIIEQHMGEDGKIALQNASTWFNYQFKGQEPSNLSKYMINRITDQYTSFLKKLGKKINLQLQIIDYRTKIAAYENELKNKPHNENERKKLQQKIKEAQDQIDESEQHINDINAELSNQNHGLPALVSNDPELRATLELIILDPEAGMKALREYDINKQENVTPEEKADFDDFRRKTLRETAAQLANKKYANQANNAANVRLGTHLITSTLRHILAELDRHGHDVNTFVEINDAVQSAVHVGTSLYELKAVYDNVMACRAVGEAAASIENVRAILENLGKPLAALIQGAVSLYFFIFKRNYRRADQVELISDQVRRDLGVIATSLRNELDKFNQNIIELKQDVEAVSERVLVAVDAARNATADFRAEHVTAMVQSTSQFLRQIQGYEQKAVTSLPKVNEKIAMSVYPAKVLPEQFSGIAKLKRFYGSTGSQETYADVTSLLSKFPETVMIDNHAPEFRDLQLPNTHVLANLSTQAVNVLQKSSEDERTAQVQTATHTLHKTVVHTLAFAKELNARGYFDQITHQAQAAFKALQTRSLHVLKHMVVEQHEKWLKQKSQAATKNISYQVDNFYDNLSAIFRYENDPKRLKSTKALCDSSKEYYRKLYVSYEKYKAFIKKNGYALLEIPATSANGLPLLLPEAYLDRLIKKIESVYELTQNAKNILSIANVAYAIRQDGKDIVINLNFSMPAISGGNASTVSGDLFAIEIYRIKDRTLENLYGLPADNKDKTTLQNLLVLDLTLARPKILFNACQDNKSKQNEHIEYQKKIIHALDGHFLANKGSNCNVKSVEPSYVQHESDIPRLDLDLQHLQDISSAQSTEKDKEKSLTHFSRTAKTARGKTLGYASRMSYYQDIMDQIKAITAQMRGEQSARRPNWFSRALTRMAVIVTCRSRIAHLKGRNNAWAKSFEKDIKDQKSEEQATCQKLNDEGHTFTPFTGSLENITARRIVKLDQDSKKFKNWWASTDIVEFKNAQSFNMQFLGSTEGIQPNNLSKCLEQVWGRVEQALSFKVSEQISFKAVLEHYTRAFNQLVRYLVHAKNITSDQAIALIKKHTALPFVGDSANIGSKLDGFVEKLFALLKNPVHLTAAAQTAFYQQFTLLEDNPDYQIIRKVMLGLTPFVDCNAKQQAEFEQAVAELFTMNSEHTHVLRHIMMPDQKPQSFIVETLPIDGSALYRAVARAVGDTDHQQLRQRVAGHLRTHYSTHYATIISALYQGRTLLEHAAAIEHHHEWPDQLEISILEKILDRPIVVINQDNLILKTDFGKQPDYASDKTIFVLYNGQHYDALAKLAVNTSRPVRHAPPQSKSNNMPPRTQAASQPSTSAKSAAHGYDNHNQRFSVHRIAPDGNCLFAAIAHQLRLTGFVQAHTEHNLRRIAVDHLKSHRDHYAAFVDGNFDQYLNTMARNGIWGGDQEITALAKELCIAINIIQPDAPTLVRGNPLSEQRIFLQYNGTSHYDSLVPSMQATEEVYYDAPACAAAR